MECPYCNCEIEDDSKYCKICGNDLSKEPVQEGFTTLRFLMLLFGVGLVGLGFILNAKINSVNIPYGMTMEQGLEYSRIVGETQGNVIWVWFFGVLFIVLSFLKKKKGPTERP